MLLIVILAVIGFGAAIPHDRLTEAQKLLFHPHQFKPETRIINGHEAKPHAYPYQVLIKSRHILIPIICGGSLIKNDTILTAAHCVQGALWLEVTLGAHNRSDTNEPSQIHLLTQSWTYHKNWSKISLHNDIALVKLPYAIQLNKYINTVELASDVKNNYENSTAVVTGWGETYDSSPLSSILKFVEVRVLSNDECRSVIPFDTVIIDSHLCTDGNGSKGFCNGDSGGPLVVAGRQIGIVSFTYPSCQKSKPSVYTRVTSFTNWLKQFGGF